VDAVVVATATPDHSCPATAPLVAEELGLRGAAAYDVAAVCSGFLYGLATGSGLIAAGVASSVLLVAADTFSTIVNPRDRTTAPIFGDGAGAVVLQAGEAGQPGALGPFDLGSDGSGKDLIIVPGGGSRERVSGLPPTSADQWFHMEGPSVYRAAVKHMTASAERVLERAGWRMGDVDRFVGHQANQRLLYAVAARLGLPQERCVLNVHRVGNTAAASVPLALAAGAMHAKLRTGHRLLLTAFGGGLTWGSTVLRWPDVTPVWGVSPPGGYRSVQQ
jgi:3-oxoacyl-[acyl-carrier-protein] synthase-3